MRYTIVTPTICRPSLARLCESVDSQAQTDWEHLVVVDVPREKMTQSQWEILGSIPARANRVFSHCDTRHKNYGHTCRHNIWDRVMGEYILYVDDDDYLADSEVLRTLDSVTQPWAVFPVVKFGKKWLHLPPGVRATGTGMFVHRKEIGRWPDSDLYDADGLFVEELAQKYSYRVLESRPLVVQPKSSCGVSNADTWLGSVRAKLVEYRVRLHKVKEVSSK